MIEATLFFVLFFGAIFYLSGVMMTMAMELANQEEKTIQLNMPLALVKGALWPLLGLLELLRGRLL